MVYKKYIKRDGKVPMTNERIVESVRNILKEVLKKWNLI